MIQYGYGDENNSIDILVKGGRGPGLRDTFNTILNRRSADRPDKPFNVVAAPFVATGRFRWGPMLHNDEICGAQELVRGGSDPDRRYTGALQRVRELLEERRGYQALEAGLRAS